MGINRELSQNSYGGLGDTGRINYIKEENFSVLPEGSTIWNGKLPYGEGTRFPTQEMQERANRYLTNKSLYKQNYNGIIPNMISPRDYMVDTITNMSTLNINNDLPDYNLCTETWVNFMTINPPSVDGVTKKNVKVHDVVDRSNFYSIYKQIIRGTLFMYGNYAVKVLSSDGEIKIEPMALKCWEPFVSSENITKIAVNVFFNIYNKGGKQEIEFIEYHNTGKIVKTVFEYSKGVIGAELEKIEDRAFKHVDASPIVIFTGNTVDGEIYGDDVYSKWTPAIVGAMRAYTQLMIETNRITEIIRKMPSGVTDHDEATGITTVQQHGSVLYKYDSTGDYNIPEVEIIRPDVRVKEAREVYDMTVERLSRDTGLSITVFKPELLGTSISGKTIKNSNFNTESRGRSMLQDIIPQIKELVNVLILASGDDIDYSNLALNISANFIQDIETDSTIARERIESGTLSKKDAIKMLDTITDAEAEFKLQQINGEGIDKKPVVIEEGTNGGIRFTDSEKEEDVENGQYRNEVLVLPTTERDW